jgi:hypothetical protein
MMALGTPPKPDRFDERLQKASAIIGGTPAALISLKARPIREIDTYDTDYLSGSDYQGIEEAFRHPDLEFIADLEWVCNGRTRLYEVKGGTRFLFVEHESGPELILHEIVLIAGAVSAVAFAANQVILLFNRISKALQGRYNKKERDEKGRFLPVSIEKRTKNGQKLIRQIGRTARSVERALKSVEDLADHDTNTD